MRRSGPRNALFIALLAGVILDAVVVLGKHTARPPAQIDDVLSETREISLDLANADADISETICAPTFSGSDLSIVSAVSSTCPSRLRPGEICTVVMRASADDNNTFETFPLGAGRDVRRALAHRHGFSRAVVSGGEPRLDVVVPKGAAAAGRSSRPSGL